MGEVTKAQIQVYRDKSPAWSYKKISDELGISVSTIKRKLKEPNPKVFPYYQSAVISRLYTNTRLIGVTYDGITQVAVKPPRMVYRLRQEVTLEIVDEKTARVL